MEPDAKVDNDIAMMMIKKRIEQTPLMIPTIQVLLERVELPGPHPVVLLDICDPRSTDRRCRVVPGSSFLGGPIVPLIHSGNSTAAAADVV